MHYGRSGSVQTSVQRILIACVFAQGFLFLTCGSGCAQPSAARTSPGASKAHLREQRFVEALQLIAKQWKIGIVVEGSPMPSGSIPADLRLDADLKEAVDQVSRQYDYDIQRRGNVFLLTKRYTDPADYPDITPDEYRLALAAASRVLAGFNPKFTSEEKNGTPVAAIGRLLTPEQTDALAHGGIPVQSLSTEQRAEAWKIALRYYVQFDAEAATTSANYLNSIFKQDPVFKRKVIQGIDAFGFEVSGGSPPKPTFYPMSNPDSVHVGPKGAIVRISSGDKKTVAPTTDRTDPNAEGSVPVTVPESSGIAMTLNRMVDDLNVRSNGVNRYKVDPVLAAKTVVAVGMDFVPPFEMFQALAELYGLRLKQDDDHSVLLTRKRDPAAQTLDQVPRALREMVPTPLRHWFHARQQSPERFHSGENPLLREDYANPATEARLAAIRLFRAKVEPEVLARKDKQIRLSELSDDTKKLFALTLAIGDLGQVAWMGERAAPPYVTDFDHIILTGSLTAGADGKPRLAMFLSYKDPRTGQLHQGTGFVNARIP